MGRRRHGGGVPRNARAGLVCAPRRVFYQGRSLSPAVTDHARMLDRFAGLCEISSPTGEEREGADAVLDELRGLGVDVAEDASATPAQAGAGNLVARIPGRQDRWLSFFAHLDTVPHDGPIEVAREGGVFRSAGDTILGADNKAAVPVPMGPPPPPGPDPPTVGLELAFTVAEED